jgi:uncharacterized protein
MLEIDETAAVPVPPERVWSVLSDPVQVVSLIPDAEIVSENEDGSYDGRFAVKFGPIRVRVMARVDVEFDEAARSGRITARGGDSEGGFNMTTAANFEVRPADGADGSVLQLSGTVDLSGRLASQIRPAADLVVKRMSNDFVEALARRLRTDEAPGSTADRPAPWLAGVTIRAKQLLAWLRRSIGRKQP